jgi:hypothetical protein
MSEHKFKIGERLFPARSIGSDVSEGAYIVVKRLPKHDGEFQYQIKSVNETDERVVRESQLKPSPWRNPAGRPYSSAGTWGTQTFGGRNPAYRVQSVPLKGRFLFEKRLSRPRKAVE